MEQFTEFYQLTKPIEVVNPTSSVEKIYGPYPTMEEALSELSLLGLKGRQFTLVAENGEVDLYLYQENLEPKLVTKSYKVFNSDTDGLVPKSTTATASMYLNGVGQWTTPPNTTYSSGSLSTLNDTPTNTTNRIWSASILNQWLDSKNFITDTTYATFTKDVGGLVPAPTGTTSTRYLREDGTWVVPTNTTYSAVTTAEYNTIVSGTATSTSGRVITPKMLQDIVDNANFNKAKKLSAPVNINGIPFDGSEDITIPVGDNGEVYNVFNSTTNGLVPTPNETNATKFLRADGTWVIPTNTTYSLVTQANIDLGTETAARLWSVKLIVDNFAKKDHVHEDYLKIRGVAAGLNLKERYNVGISSWSDNTTNTPTGYGTLLSFTNDGLPHDNSTNWLTHLMFATNGRIYYGNKINNGGYDGSYEVYTTKNSDVADAISKRHTHNQSLNTTNDVTFNKVNNVKIAGGHKPQGDDGTIFNTMFGESATNYNIGTSYDTFISYGATMHWKAMDVGANLTVSPFSVRARVASTHGWARDIAFTDNPTNITAPAFYTSSLRKYKKDIKPFDKSGLDLINSLDIVSYTRKEEEANKMIGIIADDSPSEFLNKEKTAVDNYSTEFITIKAVQELYEIIKDLQKQVRDLQDGK